MSDKAKDAKSPKFVQLNGTAVAHSVYAGAGSTLAGAAFSRDPMFLGIMFAGGAASSFLMNSTFADSMMVLPHDLAAGVLSALGAYYYTGNTTIALATLIGVNNAPLVAAFLKFPKEFNY